MCFRLQVTLFDAEGQLLTLQISEVSTIDKICPLPVLNTNQKVWIAHASEDGIFLHKVQFADHLSELLQKLFEFYNDSEYAEQDWSGGEVCSAKSVNDEQWYRARILETGSDTKVLYIDYGNSETVPVSNLRKLDSAFYTPHAFALKVTLHVNWSVPVETLLELAGETEYNAVVLRSDNGWIVELVDTSGQSLTDKLVELGFAVALENSPFKRVVEGGRFVEGSVMPVAPTFIDSPLQLWVCVGDDIELVEALQDRLQEAAPKLVPLKEPIGVFAAKFSDKLWYRAIKLNENTVRFVDYGNSDIVDLSDIKELSSDFLEPAGGYAVKIELPAVEFKEGATDRLNQLLLSDETDLEGEIMAHIQFVKESYIVADISKGGKSVVDILVSENLCTRLKRISSGFISHINSLNDFYIQEVGCEEHLETMENMLTGENFEPISEIEVGDLIASLDIGEGRWYRAKVIEKSENDIIVLFIDYGHSAPATELRALPSDLMAKPYLSKHCKLQLPNGVCEWTQAAVDKFIELSANGCTQFDIKFINDESPATILLVSNENCVSEELKSLCEVTEKEDNEIMSESTSIDYSCYETNVFISHINNTKDFYVQKEGAEEELDIIKEELSDVSLFETVDPLTDEVKGELLGALYTEDELWYRAKVLGAVEGGTKVLFVDYGNTAIASEFVKLPDSLKSKLPIAIHCTLENKDWSEEADNHFIVLSDNGSTPFLMKVMKEGNPQTVSLIVGNKIVEKELDQLFGQQLKEDIIEEEEDNRLFRNSVCTTNDKSPNEIKAVYLIQVNSPDDFFLQTAEATQQLSDISDKLSKADSFAQFEESTVVNGQILAAQFEEDDAWYRAKVIDQSETEIKVLLIDYGNTAKVAKIKHLPEELWSIPPLAMHCSLQKPGNNEWSQKALETFNKLANDDGVTFDLRIISEGEPNIVDIQINGESVVEQLILVSGLVSENKSNEETEALPEEIHPEFISSINGEESSMLAESIQIGQEYNNIHSQRNSEEKFIVDLPVVEISHYNNPNDFFVQYLKDKDEIANIANELIQADNFETELNIEEILAAKLKSDQKWYRAKVIDTNSNGSTVLFVDYGNSDFTDEFRKLPKHLAEKEPLAKHCCLKSPADTWSEEIKEKLSALAKLEELTFEIKIVKHEDPFVVDLFLNGCSVIETLLAGETLHDQNEIQKMILQSVDKEILSSLKNDIREITNELLSNVHDTVNENKRTDLQQITDDLLLNVENQIDNKEKHEDDNSTAQKERPEIKSEVLTVLNTSNGVDKDTYEEEEGSSGINHESSTGNSTLGEKLKICIGSPSANRRSNIDEQIVPGCISTVKSLDSPDD